MRCAALEPLLEEIADGTIDLTAEDRAHVASCELCTARPQRARDTEQWLAPREMPEPPPSFTATVMQRVGREKWRTERAVDIGFNLAIVAGLLVILGSAAGAAWSLGVFSIDIDTSLLAEAVWPQFEAVTAQLQTIVLAAVLLTTALVLWWWAETASD